MHAGLTAVPSVVLSAVLAASALSEGHVLEASPVKIPDKARWISLGCTNPGTQQDTAKTPRVENTTVAPIPRGRSVFWKASDGDRGGVTLGKDLPPGDSVKGTGKPARVTYTCTARFDAGPPDLVVLSTDLERSPRAVVGNTNAWIDAGPVRVKFELLRCDRDSVMAADNVGPLTVAAGMKQTFAASITKPTKGPRSYYRITVDFDDRVAESNEGNNVWSGRSTCPP